MCEIMWDCCTNRNVAYSLQICDRDSFFTLIQQCFGSYLAMFRIIFSNVSDHIQEPDLYTRSGSVLIHGTMFRYLVNLSFRHVFNFKCFLNWKILPLSSSIPKSLTHSPENPKPIGSHLFPTSLSPCFPLPWKFAMRSSCGYLMHTNLIVRQTGGAQNSPRALYCNQEYRFFARYTTRQYISSSYMYIVQQILRHCRVVAKQLPRAPSFVLDSPCSGTAVEVENNNNSSSSQVGVVLRITRIMRRLQLLFSTTDGSQDFLLTVGEKA